MSWRIIFAVVLFSGCKAPTPPARDGVVPGTSRYQPTCVEMDWRSHGRVCRVLWCSNPRAHEGGPTTLWCEPEATP